MTMLRRRQRIRRLQAASGANFRPSHSERKLASCPRRFVAELRLVDRADLEQELELVAQVRAHHLRAVGGDRERETYDCPAPRGRLYSGALPDEMRCLLDPSKQRGTRTQCQSIRTDFDETFLVNADPVGKQAELDVVNYRLTAQVIRAAIGDVRFRGRGR
jgi:hypothetical protein